MASRGQIIPLNSIRGKQEPIDIFMASMEVLQITDRVKMENRFDNTLKQDYVNRVVQILYNGTIPPGKSNIMHCLILG